MNPIQQAVRHRSTSELEAGLAEILRSPKDAGRIEMIVRRPAVNEREVLDEGELDLTLGLVGDSWSRRGSSKMPDPSPHPEMQINLMSSRVVALLAQDRARWPLAGDQFYVDLDLGEENLPPGTRLVLGTAELEVSALPHTGCKKFVSRFGMDAMLFVNSGRGRQLHLRGINAWVTRPGRVRVGELIRKLS
ncbi:MAG: MOSC domain-containing protein [Thermoanaerobaculia bacterium]